jgi:hypothetical protein
MDRPDGTVLVVREHGRRWAGHSTAVRHAAGTLVADDFTEFVTADALTRRITLDDHYEKDVAHHATRRTPEQFREIKQRIEQSKTSLSARAMPGDEWWEWVSGTEPLMQSGGLALVRSGQIVYAEQHWIS